MSTLTDAIRGFLSGERLRHPIPPLDGALTPNDRLDALTPLESLFDGPDDVSPDGRGGVLVSAGPVLWQVSEIGELREFARFDALVSAFARAADGSFFVAVDSGKLCRLDHSGRQLGSVAGSDVVHLAGVTALAPDSHGGVFFTIGSTRHTAADWIHDLMEQNRCGQVGYWVPGKQPESLNDGLAYPSGLAVDADGGHLVVVESWTHAVTRYPIVGGALGMPDQLINNLTGYPSRISLARGGGYWLAVFAMRTQLVELVLRERSFRLDMMKSLDPELWIRPALKSTGSHFEPLQIGGIKRLAISKPWAPPRSYGLVVRLDASGAVIDSLHSRAAGQYHGITAVREVDRRLLIVSKGSGRVLSVSIPSEGREDPAL